MYGFEVGANRSATVEYRFDDRPGRKANVRFMRDRKTFVIEDKADVGKFVEELATANVLYLRVSSHTVGVTNAEYRVAGAPAAIEAAYDACPLKSEPAARRRSA
jgi:hypothetical protein